MKSLAQPRNSSTHGTWAPKLSRSSAMRAPPCRWSSPNPGLFVCPLLPITPPDFPGESIPGGFGAAHRSGPLPGLPRMKEFPFFWGFLPARFPNRTPPPAAGKPLRIENRPPSIPLRKLRHRIAGNASSRALALSGRSPRKCLGPAEVTKSTKGVSPADRLFIELVPNRFEEHPSKCDNNSDPRSARLVPARTRLARYDITNRRNLSQPAGGLINAPGKTRPQKKL